ncbi:hypothetical protein [Rheinheimera sp.]|uniref:hypothetical protein n=1 Tax=Rheinheimera sp. TaxID=1869214 RepID=UPI00307FBE77
MEHAEDSQVSYREKSAWLAILARLLAFGPYFVWVSLNAAQELSLWQQLQAYGLTVAVQLALLGGGYLWLRWQMPLDAKAAKDERDKAIEANALKGAYYLLMTGMILVGCLMPFSQSGWPQFQAAVFFIVLSELWHYSQMVLSYRRQAL